MDLQELQLTWNQLDQQLKDQKVLTDKLIIEMTQGKYHNKIKIISTYESIGALICFAAALYLILNFAVLDTWYLLLCGLITMAYFIILPWIVLKSISDLKRINLINLSYKDIILNYAQKQQRFLKIQRIGIYLNFILVFVSLPVLVKVMNGKNIFLTDSKIMFWYLPIMIVFLIVFSKWGYGKYKGVTDEAFKLLKDMDEA